jgi:hypothetical protein
MTRKKLKEQIVSYKMLKEEAEYSDMPSDIKDSYLNECDYKIVMYTYRLEEAEINKALWAMRWLMFVFTLSCAAALCTALLFL